MGTEALIARHDGTIVRWRSGDCKAVARAIAPVWLPIIAGTRYNSRVARCEGQVNRVLDIKAIRENPGDVLRQLRRRDPEARLDEMLELDRRRRELIRESEELKRQRNEASEEIARLKQAGEDEEAEQRIGQMKGIADRVKGLEEDLAGVEEKLQDLLARLPNIPHESVPDGDRDEDKIVIREHRERPALGFEPVHHLDLGKALGILDFPRAARIAGSRFPLYRGWGARLEMALVTFFWDFHLEHTGYIPILPPYLGNSESMYTASQLPKFQDDVYHVERDDLYLNPTAETLLCNLHRGEILPGEELPLDYMAYTACFRREAGAPGEEERGLIRMHQFNKVELFKFTTAEDSYDELEKLVGDAEAVLQALDLHYRVALLPAGDMGAQCAKTYDLEVWVPSQERYYEVSSCSNCTDYQARRGSIRYRPRREAKPQFAHTLNGSGLATSRLLASILETNQQQDGSVLIPEAIQEYVGTDAIRPPR